MPIHRPLLTKFENQKPRIRPLFIQISFLALLLWAALLFMRNLKNNQDGGLFQALFPAPPVQTEPARSQKTAPPPAAERKARFIPSNQKPPPNTP